MARVSMKNKRRIIIVFGISLIVILGLSFRTAWIQVVRGDEYSKKAVEQQTSDIPLEAKRGSIFDCNGEELATSGTCYSIWVRPAQLKKNYSPRKIAELSSKLGAVLNMKSTEVEEKITKNQALIRIARYLDKDTCDKIKKMKVTGLEIAENTKRYYPSGKFASQLLGSVSDDNEGRTGIEQEFDSYLSGVAGRWIQDTDLNGDALSYGSEKYYQAEDGLNVVLTIDEVLQHYAEKAIANGMVATKAKKIMCLVMNPKTGDVLAMATNPNFDPNDATKPTQKNLLSEWSSMTDKSQATYLSQMWRNPIVSDLYEPGSTFKLVTTSSALEEGVVQMNSHFFCNGSINVDGQILHCWNTAGHGAENLVEAVGNSCNPVQVQLVKRLGKEKYYNYLEMFGITEQTHIDLPAETTAIIQNEKSIGNVELATMSYGQGIAVTPLQLVTAVCSIGNDGVMMKPRIVKELTNSSGDVVKKYNTQEVRKTISSETAKDMREIMEYVVSDGGAGTAKIAGYRIGGKTGTANKAVAGGYSDDTFSSFIGMAPMDDPQLVVLVVVDSPKGIKFGSATAAPVAKEFLENAFSYLEIDPEYTSEEKKEMSAETAYVPDVQGKSYSDAIGILGSCNLKYKVRPSSEDNSDFTVVDQYPKAGKTIKKGGIVYLYRE